MTDGDFARKSVLDILVPEVTDLDIEEGLNSSDSVQNEEEAGLISSIRQRSVLFFDESLPLYVVLRTPYDEETSLKAHISRLAIALEAHALNSPTGGPGPPPVHGGGQARDVVWSSRLDVSEEPTTIIVEGLDGEDSQDVLLIWKMKAFLSKLLTPYSFTGLLMRSRSP